MTEVDITCLCGKVHTVVGLTQPLPVESYLCHQARCRYNLGALCHSAIPLRTRPDGVDSLSVYAFDKGLQRYFCKTCGSHLFEGDACWKVQSGVIDRIHSEQVYEALESIAGHHCVEETVDGGLSSCFIEPGASFGEEPVRKVELASQATNQHDALRMSAVVTEGNHARLQASCVCGGVQFFLTRPSDVSGLCSSPWPDLIVPYCAGSPVNTENKKWWIRGNKWLAGTCACRSCRLGLGSPIQAWTFVSRCNILQLDGSPLVYTMGTLKSFESSPGATREFCSKCGATVFWHNLERPGVVDVSVGLLRAPEGSLAKSWLYWLTERVSFAEKALDKGLISTLEAGLGRLNVTTPLV